jgi:hypothetical protein
LDQPRLAERGPDIRGACDRSQCGQAAWETA